MSVIYQSRSRPSEILLALGSLANDQVTRIRMAVAYTTRAGCDRLFPLLERNIGQENWQNIPKSIVTSFDFGHTDPLALSYLSSVPNLEISIMDPSVMDRPGMRPTTAFHPKFYLFNRNEHQSMLIGSANLSQNALTVNTEIAYLDQAIVDSDVVEMTWSAISTQSESLTTTLLERYSELRIRTPIPRPDSPATDDEPLPSIGLPSTSDILSFGDSVTSGSISPLSYDRFWIEAGSMSSGGSRNQLELPRGANQFFGFSFTDYGPQHSIIGHPQIIIAGRQWSDRPLTWHGHNAMERINLPTEFQGGFAYPNTAILFQRVPQGFELMVVPWEDYLAIMWREASANANLLFRLGQTTRRLCGLW